MNVRTIFSAVLLAVACCLTSCHKELILAPVEGPALFTRTLHFTDASGEREVALHFRAPTQETLDQINTEQYQVKPIFEAPSVKEQITMDVDPVMDSLASDHLTAPSLEQTVSIEVEILKELGDELGFLLELEKEASLATELETLSCYNVRRLTAS